MTFISISPASHMIRSTETHPLTWRLHRDAQPVRLKEYQSRGGHIVACRALTQITQDDIVQTVKDSGLKGHGGAGFPTDVEWGLTPKNESLNVRYLLRNVDEVEPSTWRGRMLMKQPPHLPVEGMLISACVLKAYRGYTFLRGEYVDAARNLDRAIDEAKTVGLLGKNILGSGSDFELLIHTGVGRYVYGEETALINSLKGRRANPRPKPLFPAAIGIWGKPTYVDSAETLYNVPAIVSNGVDWYKALARPDSEDMDTKLMGFSGKVKNPGPRKLSFGIDAHELLKDCAGGIHNGFQLKAWQPGGVDTDFLLPGHLGVQMLIDGIARVGTRTDTGLAMAVNGNINMVFLLRDVEELFVCKSCGWCTPCCDGLP